LADALEKLGRASERLPMDTSPATAHMFIVNPLTGGGLMSLFSTHPPIAERIARLRRRRGAETAAPPPSPPAAHHGESITRQGRAFWDRLK
jgi:heat shock protein HtpX